MGLRLGYRTGTCPLQWAQSGDPSSNKRPGLGCLVRVRMKKQIVIIEEVLKFILVNGDIKETIYEINIYVVDI